MKLLESLVGLACKTELRRKREFTSFEKRNEINLEDWQQIEMTQEVRNVMLDSSDSSTRLLLGSVLLMR